MQVLASVSKADIPKQALSAVPVSYHVSHQGSHTDPHKEVRADRHTLATALSAAAPAAASAAGTVSRSITVTANHPGSAVGDHGQASERTQAQPLMPGAVGTAHLDRVHRKADKDTRPAAEAAVKGHGLPPPPKLKEPDHRSGVRGGTDRDKQRDRSREPSKHSSGDKSATDRDKQRDRSREPSRHSSQDRSRDGERNRPREPTRDKSGHVVGHDIRQQDRSGHDRHHIHADTRHHDSHKHSLHGYVSSHAHASEDRQSTSSGEGASKDQSRYQRSASNLDRPSAHYRKRSRSPYRHDRFR